MKLKKLSFRNFKSYSNVLTEISFDDNSSLNLIVGENGSGKTSIAECATYLLYGKLENFTASDIPNDINKNFYGKIELDCDGHEVIIERGLNPGLFNVVVDGQTVDTAGKNNVQNMLEETYFKIPYTVFHNVLVLEIGSAKSLLDMAAADKRNIIDKICGFTIYNSYGKVIKEDLKVLNGKISTNDGSLKSMNYTMEQYEQRIEELKKNEVSQEDIDALKKKVNEAKTQKAKNDVLIKKIQETSEQLRNTNIQKVGEYNNLKEKILVIDKKIKLIDGGKCPTCGSSLETEDFQKEREELVSQKENYENQQKMIIEMVNKTKSKIDIFKSKEQEIQADTSSTNLINLQSDLQYMTTLASQSVSPIEDLKKDLADKLDEIRIERNELEKNRRVLDFLNAMFRDGGVKRYVSNTYVPMINTLMMEMLQYMDLNYTVTFDNDFNATIVKNGMVKKYSTLSKGEKRRVDFAAVVAFIKFLKLQFGELNLLFLDELFSNVDTNGMSDMIEILRGLSKDMNLNIYLIHHAKLEGVLFDRVMHVKKIDGFSTIEYI